MPIANYWEKLGSLMRAGHVDSHLIRGSIGPDCQVWWAILGPMVRKQRLQSTDPTIWEHFEWASARMDAIDARTGTTTDRTEEWVEDVRAYILETNVEQVRDAEELRTVIVRTSDPARPAALPPSV